MKTILGLLVAVLVLASLGPVTADAQNFREMRRELEEQQESTRSEIESLQQQLKNLEEQITRKQSAYDELYQQYQNTRREISLRESLIDNMIEERNQLESEIEVLQSSIEQLRNDLDHLIEQYKQTLTYLYKKGRMSNLALILSAESVNQMLIRAVYLEEFDEHRQRQARQIEEKQVELREEEEALKAARERVAENISETETEQEEFEQVRRRQEEQIAELQEDRRRLRNREERRRREARELENTLTELIEEEMEIREAEEERRRELEEMREQRLADAEEIRGGGRGGSSAGGGGSIPGEAEMEEISDRFEQRRGTLPWPVNSNTIAEQFGERENPLYGTRIYNPGIQIAADAGDDVRVVHDGYVFAVRPMTGYGNTIFVNHGGYNTVYGNLSEIHVSSKTVLEEGDVIGKSGDEESLNGQVLFFMISKGSTDHYDPQEWMSKP